MAAAPMACSSAVPFSRTTPASAPATAVGFDLAATLSTFIVGSLLRGVGRVSGPDAAGSLSFRGARGESFLGVTGRQRTRELALACALCALQGASTGGRREHARTSLRLRFVRAPGSQEKRFHPTWLLRRCNLPGTRGGANTRGQALACALCALQG